MLSHFDLDNLETAKSVLFGMYVLATIGVVVGVYWESEKFTESKRHRGWRLLVWSLAVETILTVAISSTEAEISSRQRAEIISLQKKLAPRVLSAAQKSMLAERLKAFPNIRYAFSAGSGEEALNFGIALAAVFKTLDWEWVDWPPDTMRINIPYPGPGSDSSPRRVGIITLSGVEIRAQEWSQLNPAKELVRALRDAGFDLIRESPANAKLVPPPANATGTSDPMMIMIGQKP